MFRSQDAKRGVRVAQVLEGFISRKVVKQTVMTVVYGVTRYGGRLQIERRLRELSDFPQVRSLAGAWPRGSVEVSPGPGPPPALNGQLLDSKQSWGWGLPPPDPPASGAPVSLSERKMGPGFWVPSGCRVVVFLGGGGWVIAHPVPPPTAAPHPLQEFVWEASHYLVRQVFNSLQEMFSGTRAIQVCPRPLPGPTGLSLTSGALP